MKPAEFEDLVSEVVSCFDDIAENDNLRETVNDFVSDVLTGCNIEVTETYYLASITEIFGEYESQERIIVDNDDERNLMRIAARWRGAVDSTASDAEIQKEYSDEVGGFWFDGNAVKIPQIDRTITKDERDILSTALYEAPPFEPDEER